MKHIWDLKHCAGIDGQCASSWCDCNRFMQAAIEGKGNVYEIMRLTDCRRSVAIRAAKWYRDQIDSKETKP